LNVYAYETKDCNQLIHIAKILIFEDRYIIEIRVQHFPEYHDCAPWLKNDYA
jgi:hypothetical protein